MEAANYPDELDYINAQLHPLMRHKGDQSFPATFLHACLRADADNYEILRPALAALMQKYPANRTRLWMERHERGIREEMPADVKAELEGKRWTSHAKTKF